MTNEEAIDIIKCLAWHRRPNEEDIEQAIKALEQEPCEDVISRQIISDYVESHIQEINTGYGDLNKHTNRILRMIMEYIDKLPPVTQKTKWIPVSERLPNDEEYIKNNGLFNVSDGNRSYFGWFDIYTTKKFVKPTIAGFCVDNAVTAWKPLPKPYKESEEADGK